MIAHQPSTLARPQQMAPLATGAPCPALDPAAIRQRLYRLLAAHLSEQRRLREAVNADARSTESDTVYRKVENTAHRQALAIIEEMGLHNSAAAWTLVGSLLRQHSFHTEILLQSEFIRHALRKPRGYAGDSDLMNIIYANADRGSNAFAILTNRVYQSLPAAEAVRQRSRAIESLLRALPAGSRILNLACGPAREVAAWLPTAPDSTQIDLFDHDIKTVALARRVLADSRVRHLVGNAFQIIKGNLRVAEPRSALLSWCDPVRDFRSVRAFVAPIKYRLSELKKCSYDLIYSAGLYDYIEHFPENPERGTIGLTKRLFDLLRPGGRLLIGNFLSPGVPGNPHRLHHRGMMEWYSDWNLLYRTWHDVREFASAVPNGQFALRELNEGLDDARGRPACVGFLEVTRLV